MSPFTEKGANFNRYIQYVEVPGKELNNNLVGRVYHCVLWDNPFIFSVGEYAMWKSLSEDGKRIKITTLCDKHSEEAYRKQVEDVVNQILATPGLKQMNDFQKEVFVHDFIINNVFYDETRGNKGARIQPYTVYGALIERSAVCEGIAKTVKLLLNMLDVKCIVVSGEYDGTGHSWNIVKIGNGSYHLDVTMDMGRVVHKGMMRYNYFNFRDGEIDKYRLTNSDILPACRAISENYVVRAGGYVSNYDRLLLYTTRSLTNKKPCLYFKVNRNAGEDYTTISFEDFKNEVEKACHEAIRKSRINATTLMDATGPGEIVNVEITYL